MASELPWVLSLSDEQRRLFRERGHLLAASLLLHLDAAQPEGAAHHLKEASVSAGDYGRIAAGMGLSLSQTIEGFLRFRAPFHHELSVAARRRGFDASETSDLLETAERGHGSPAGRHDDRSQPGQPAAAGAAWPWARTAGAR